MKFAILCTVIILNGISECMVGGPHAAYVAEHSHKCKNLKSSSIRSHQQLIQ